MAYLMPTAPELMGQTPVQNKNVLIVTGFGNLPSIDNDKARRILGRGISSKTIEPMSAYLGVGKTELANFLDVDRGTIQRRATRNQA